MFFRHLLFIGLVGAGLVALAAGLSPDPQPQRQTDLNAESLQASGLRTVVEAVNQSFREKWDKLGLQPAPPASAQTVARRLSLGLTGTIPSLQELRQSDALPEPERLAWWLGGLLRDRRSADYLAERLARATVGTEDGPFIVFRRRRFVTWLSDELVQNRAYDQLVRSLITAEGLWTDTPATNFLTVTITPGMNRPDAVRMAGRVSRAFLGLRLDCAQCHNHPYARWTQDDFHGLAAFFGQVRTGFVGLHDGAGGEHQLEEHKTGIKRAVAPNVPFGHKLLPEEGDRRERLAAWVTHGKNPYFARAIVNRAWAWLFGRPLVEPVDNLEAAEEQPAALQLLADDFTAHRYDLRRLLTVIAATEAFQLDSASAGVLTESHEKTWAAFPLTRLRPEQVIGSVAQAASVTTIDSESHILVRTARLFQGQDFVKRYGDAGEDELDPHGGTISQRLLLMNGKLVRDKIEQGFFGAAEQIGKMARDDRGAVEAAYLAVLTRPPTDEEAAHFQDTLAGTKGQERTRRMHDLYWALINSTEFSWNH